MKEFPISCHNSNYLHIYDWNEYTWSQVGYTWVSIISIPMNIDLLSPPPVGLT